MNEEQADKIIQLLTEINKSIKSIDVPSSVKDLDGIYEILEKMNDNLSEIKENKPN